MVKREIVLVVASAALSLVAQAGEIRSAVPNRGADGVIESVMLSVDVPADQTNYLYCVLGATEGAEDSTNGWESVMFVGGYSGETFVRVASPSGWGNRVKAMRFFLSDGAGGEFLPVCASLSSTRLDNQCVNTEFIPTDKTRLELDYYTPNRCANKIAASAGLLVAGALTGELMPTVIHVVSVSDAFLYEEGPRLTVAVSVSVEAGPALADVLPSVGVTNVVKGTTVVFTAPEWAYRYGEKGTAFARHAYRGYVGTGDAPASGSEREFSVTVSNDTSVVWRYDERASGYLLTCRACLEGVPEGDYDSRVYTAWLTNGTTFRLSFPADAAKGDAFTYAGRYAPPGSMSPRTGTYDFRLGAAAYAQTDSDAWCYLFNDQNGEMSRAVDITMDDGVDLWSCYYNETERSVGDLPYWWYMRYLWGGEMMFGYDSSSVGDPDGDGFDNETECADATDPVDDESFRFEIESFSPTEMTFTGSVKGNLIVERCDFLGGEWKGVLTNVPPRASTLNAVRFGEGVASNHFYRVIYSAD